MATRGTGSLGMGLKNGTSASNLAISRTTSELTRQCRTSDAPRKPHDKLISCIPWMTSHTLRQPNSHKNSQFCLESRCTGPQSAPERRSQSNGNRETQLTRKSGRRQSWRWRGRNRRLLTADFSSSWSADSFHAPCLHRSCSIDHIIGAKIRALSIRGYFDGRTRHVGNRFAHEKP